MTTLHPALPHPLKPLRPLGLSEGGKFYYLGATEDYKYREARPLFHHVWEPSAVDFINLCASADRDPESHGVVVYFQSPTPYELLPDFQTLCPDLRQRMDPWDKK